MVVLVQISSLMKENKVRRLTFKDSVGSGFFAAGQTIRTTDTKAEVIGYNQARRTIYLGKIGRTQSTGADYHTATFAAGALLNTYNERYGTACLALSPGVAPHTFVSGVANAITASVGASGTFTAAAGTTYDPLSGLLVLNIGTHSLTTSNKVTIADNGITFTCDQDNNTSNKTYPRSTDPASGQALTITATTSTTVTVNVEQFLLMSILVMLPLLNLVLERVHLQLNFGLTPLLLQEVKHSLTSEQQQLNCHRICISMVRI